MIAYIVLIISLALMVVMSTIGGVLLTKFWAAGLSRATRTLIATVLGSVALFIVASATAISERSVDLELAGVLAAFFVLPMLMVGWPTAAITTRKLDKLTEIKASVFE